MRCSTELNSTGVCEKKDEEITECNNVYSTHTSKQGISCMKLETSPHASAATPSQTET